MEDEQLKIIAEQVSAIAKEMALKLSKFDKKTAEVFYGNNIAFVQQHTSIDSTENSKAASNAQRVKKFQEEIAKNSASVSENLKQKAVEMGKIIKEGTDKIELLYENLH